MAGTVIGGRYQLRTAIGNGGMGTVWQAADTLLRRDVAVKEVLLPAGMAAADRDALYERTMREARAAAALSHPSVVQVYDVVTENGRPWIVMELLHARSLADMIISDGPLAPRAVAKIGIALLGALEVAHSAGVLHRDVKPANVLICTDGRCVLTDFGVARMPSESNLTTPGMVLGSPHFISPERAVGGAFGPPSDLFSLGVSLFTAVEGQPPFDKGDPFDTMRAVVEEAPASPVRAGPLVPVLYGLLEKDPARRWDVRAAREELRRLLAGPLANPAAQHVTDPYTVVPVTAPTRPAYPADSGRGKIGGRAMLAPGESPADRLAHRGTPGASGGPVPEPPGTVPAPQGTAYRAGTVPAASWPRPAGGPDPAGGSPPDHRPPGYPAGGHPGGPAQATSAYPASAPGYPAPPAGPRHGGSGGGILADLAGAVRGWARRLAALPRAAQLGTACGLTVVLVLAIVWLAGGSGDASTPTADGSSPTPSASAGPTFPVREYHDARGFSLSLPADWTQKGKSPSYVDFVDPDDEGRYLRVNVEPAGGSNADFMAAVARSLDNPDHCPSPFEQVALRDDVTLGGQPAIEMEYTCGTGGDARHGIWRATVIDKHAYEFYLTVPDREFDASKPIYEEAVRTYRLNLAN